MKQTAFARSLAFSLTLCLTACSRGGGGDPGEARAGDDFAVRGTWPPHGGVVFLNDAISIDFSREVDLASVSLATVHFEARDQQGVPIAEQVTGRFRVVRSPGDAAVGRRLQFEPSYPTADDYGDGGLRASRRYLVQLVGGTAANGTVLRDRDGKALHAAFAFEFATVQGTQAQQLFRNPKSGGPRRNGLTVSSADDLGNVPLNVFGAPPVEVRLSFDQALSPHGANVPRPFVGNPLLRDASDRGRIWLDYEDPAQGPGVFVWLPADLVLEHNGVDGAVVALRPLGVLPNNARVRIFVDRRLEDIAGESNLAEPAYDPVFGEFRTDGSYAARWNAVVEPFVSAAAIDLTAPFPEPQAEVHAGHVRASFAFEGGATTLEYDPPPGEVVLNTAFTQITPAAGLPFHVSGGVFRFRNVHLGDGVHVRGTGPNPMVWLCTGDFTVDGILSVAGGDGDRTLGVGAANIAKAGGIGVCGGGNGGDGTPSATLRDLTGGTGRGAMQVPGKGGRGGRICCDSACYSGATNPGGGSGGGGGTLATQGDPHYRGAVPAAIAPNVPPTANTAFQQLRGFGGAGCGGSSGARFAFLAGGEPGDRVFDDTRDDNDFWGSGIRLAPTGNLRITGELTVPTGGSGGGGGGDTAFPMFPCGATTSPTYDASGAGGGAGGGVLIVKALGTIRVGPTGRITADGGDGGGGEPLGSCHWAGGGGGGAGGMVVLMAAGEIVLHAHGSPAANRFTYADDDYDFCVSADGGACLVGAGATPLASAKYPASGTAMANGATYDHSPLGGLGGMGIVQLMVPPGDNSDGTNTTLDDHIVVLRPTVGGGATVLAGGEKQAMLAWRGFPDAAGTWVDDAGNPTGVGSDEGDIRPAPILLPVPFGAKSRLRSRWLDSGCSGRRELPAPDGLPRGVVGAPSGPAFEFAGVAVGGATAGYATYHAIGTDIALDQPACGAPVAIAARDASATFLGEPAYRLTLADAAFAESDRYAQYEAELLAPGGGVVGSFRILGHGATDVLLAPDGAVLPPDATQLQVRAKFFRVVVGGSEGLGPGVPASGGDSVRPRVNVRLGFAFHQAADAPGGRFPGDEQQFLHDLQDPGLLGWIATYGAPRFVQWDVVFDRAFAAGGPAVPLSPDAPYPELHWLRLPFRF